ncbi:MAG: prepilin-type N-terminal cleavage/methylation domain-containing protein [Verrucomicrobiota bacterium]
MRRQSTSNNGGFSLFEIVVAMAILGLIATSVMSVLWQAGDTAADLRTLDRRDEEVSRFVSLLRETIEGLPPEAGLAISPAEETESGFPELKLENSPTGFVFGKMVGSCEEAYIALMPSQSYDPGTPLFDLALSRDDFIPEDSDNSGMAFRSGAEDSMQMDESGRYWLPLLTGIASASWRYWDDDEQEWLDEWTEEDVMPALLEFTLLDSPEGLPRRFVFEVPHRLVNPEEAQQVVVVTAGSSSSSAASDSDTNGGGDTSGAAAQGSGQGDRGRGDGAGRRGGGGGPGGRRPGGGPGGGRPGGGGPGGAGGGNGGTGGGSGGNGGGSGGNGGGG